MLKRTFMHIPGIGEQTEARMWRQGISGFDQLIEDLKKANDCGESTPRQKKVHHFAEASRSALNTGDWRFFYNRLPPGQHWRLLGENLKTAYLDIETTGLEPYSDHITTICVYDGTVWKSYVFGSNLEAFKDDIREYELLVTYNGKTFDIPFINSFFNIKLDTPHVDLRYPLAARGYKGGLKSIEHKLGLGRKDALGEIDGFMAVRLWREYILRGNARALETMLAYNLEDVFNLAPLGDRVFNMCLPETFGSLKRKQSYTRPEIPYSIDAELVRRLKS